VAPPLPQVFGRLSPVTLPTQGLQIGPVEPLAPVFDGRNVIDQLCRNHAPGLTTGPAERLIGEHYGL
jgi:hypothetical protein